MATERIIGIDFGTSTSVIRVKRYKDGVPVSPSRLDVIPVKFSVSEDVAPTVIQKVSDATYYGSNALVRKRGEEVFTNFKVDLESEDDELRQQARDLTADYFTYLYQAYNNDSMGGNLGDPDDIEKTIVSYPVKWSDETKQFMLECAEKAGFKNVTGMDEASAAIHAALVRSEDSLKSNGYLTDGVPTNIMLVDMGAGTTDIVICRYTPGKDPDFKVLATWPQSGESLFGGHETDDLLRDYVLGLVPEGVRDKVQKRYDAMKFKAWKEATVSKQLKNNDTVKSYVALEEYVWDLDSEMGEIRIDRSRFEYIAQDYLSEYVKMLNDSIQAANLNSSQIDLVVLTGGHSQWYFADELLADMRYLYLPKIQRDKNRILRLIRPQETVAMGLVYTPIHVEPVSNNPSKSCSETKSYVEPKSGTKPFTEHRSGDQQTMREIHTMPADRKSIIRYYQRFMHRLVHVKDDMVCAVSSDRRFLSNNFSWARSMNTTLSTIDSLTLGVYSIAKDGSVRFNISPIVSNVDLKNVFAIVDNFDNKKWILTVDGDMFEVREDGSVTERPTYQNVVDCYLGVLLFKDGRVRLSNYLTNENEMQRMQQMKDIYSIDYGCAITNNNHLIPFNISIDGIPNDKIVSVGRNNRFLLALTDKNKLFIRRQKSIDSIYPLPQNILSVFDKAFSDLPDSVAVQVYNDALQGKAAGWIDSFAFLSTDGDIIIKQFVRINSIWSGEIKQFRYTGEKRMGWKLF